VPEPATLTLMLPALGTWRAGARGAPPQASASLIFAEAAGACLALAAVGQRF